MPTFQIHIKNKIVQTDKQLEVLQDQVRQTNKPREITKNKNVEKIKNNNKKPRGEDYEKTKQKSQETLKDLEVLQL